MIQLNLRTRMLVNKNIELTRISDHVSETIKQHIKALTVAHGIDVETAEKFVLSKINDKTIKDFYITNSRYKDNGDRIKERTSLRNYFECAVTDNNIIVPALTTYNNPSEKQSIVSLFNRECTAVRNVHKKNFFMYTQTGEYDKAEAEAVLSAVEKTSNNSVSGALASPSTNLYMPTGHSSLTSITRYLTSTSNAVTESFTMGNKLLDSVQRVYAYITAVITYMDTHAVNTVMKKYKLVVPTVDDLLLSLERSTSSYMADTGNNYTTELRNYLEMMSDAERAAVMYTNDFYHMRHLNPALIKKILSLIGVKQTLDNSKWIGENINNVDVVCNVLVTTDTTVRSLAHYICMDEVGSCVIDYASPEIMRNIAAKEAGVVIAGNMVNISKMFDAINDLANAFFLTKVSPPSIAYIKDLYRETIVISNTDSTCGSYDDWVKWYYGEMRFGPEAMGIAATVMTINKLVSDHHIRIYTTCMGVPEKLRSKLAMKNEFGWPVFTSPSIAGHYFAHPVVREDVVLKDPKPEIKGVHILGSKSDQVIVKSAHDFIKSINSCVLDNGRINLEEMLIQVADYEREIINDLRSGGVRFYIKDQIRRESAYKQRGEESKYREHIMWGEVFAAKYGVSDEPDYVAYAVPLSIANKTEFNSFVGDMDDKALSFRLTNYLNKSGRATPKTIYVPMSNISDNTMIRELINYVDVRGIVNRNCKSLYIVLESIGYNKNPDKLLIDLGY